MDTLNTFFKKSLCQWEKFPYLIKKTTHNIFPLLHSTAGTLGWIYTCRCHHFIEITVGFSASMSFISSTFCLPINKSCTAMHHKYTYVGQPVLNNISEFFGFAIRERELSMLFFCSPSVTNPKTQQATPYFFTL